MSSSSHGFPLFRQHFIAQSAWSKEAATHLQAAPGPSSKEDKRDPVVKMAGSGPKGTARSGTGTNKACVEAKHLRGPSVYAFTHFPLLPYSKSKQYCLQDVNCMLVAGWSDNCGRFAKQMCQCTIWCCSLLEGTPQLHTSLCDVNQGTRSA